MMDHGPQGRHEIIPNPDHCLEASIHSPELDDWVMVPVIAWDRRGRALIATKEGTLCPAIHVHGFRELTNTAFGITKGKFTGWMPSRNKPAKEAQ